MPSLLGYDVVKLLHEYFPKPYHCFDTTNGIVLPVSLPLLYTRLSCMYVHYTFRSLQGRVFGNHHGVEKRCANSLLLRENFPGRLFAGAVFCCLAARSFSKVRIALKKMRTSAE